MIPNPDFIPREIIQIHLESYSLCRVIAYSAISLRISAEIVFNLNRGLVEQPAVFLVLVVEANEIPEIL